MTQVIDLLTSNDRDFCIKTKPWTYKAHHLASNSRSWCRAVSLYISEHTVPHHRCRSVSSFLLLIHPHKYNNETFAVNTRHHRRGIGGELPSRPASTERSRHLRQIERDAKTRCPRCRIQAKVTDEDHSSRYRMQTLRETWRTEKGT